MSEEEVQKFAESEFARQAMSDEPMHPDLVPYYDEETGWLKHPLVFSFGPRPGIVNHSYAVKKREVARAIEKKDWAQFIFWHERAYRTDALVELIEEHADDLSMKDLAKLAADVWTDSENIWQNTEEWQQIFDALKSRHLGSLGLYVTGWVRDFMISDEDKEAFEALPEELTIYRGAKRGVNDYGFSWTLDHAVARFFAGRLISADEEPVIIHAQVKKADVIAYFNEGHRHEREVVVDPNDALVTRYERPTFHKED